MLSVGEAGPAEVSARLPGGRTAGLTAGVSLAWAPLAAVGFAMAGFLGDDSAARAGGAEGSEVTDGWAVGGEATEGRVVEGEATGGWAVGGEATEGRVVEGEATGGWGTGSGAEG